MQTEIKNIRCLCKTKLSKKNIFSGNSRSEWAHRYSWRVLSLWKVDLKQVTLHSAQPAAALASLISDWGVVIYQIQTDKSFIKSRSRHVNRLLKGVRSWVKTSSQPLTYTRKRQTETFFLFLVFKMHFSGNCQLSNFRKKVRQIASRYTAAF